MAAPRLQPVAPARSATDHAPADPTPPTPEQWSRKAAPAWLRARSQAASLIDEAVCHESGGPGFAAWGERLGVSKQRAREFATASKDACLADLLLLPRDGQIRLIRLWSEAVAAPLAADNLHALLLAAVAESGDPARALVNGLADGTLDEDDLSDLEREASEAAAKYADLAAAARARRTA